MKKVSIDFLLKNSHYLNKEVILEGWIRYIRNNIFIIVNDGSTINNLQIVIDKNKIDKSFIKTLNISDAIKIEGIILKSKGTEQKLELLANKIYKYSDSYPDKLQKTILQPKKHSLEKLRKQAHLRFRTNIFSSIMRIRHKVSLFIHNYLNNLGFYYINTPIITSIDAEGAGQMFKVIKEESYKPSSLLKNCNDTNLNNKKSIDFFGRPTYLTVSGQLEAEAAAMALNKVYTFGPIFRAEKSNTYRHLSEFWMIELEMAFFTLNQNIDFAEKLLKFLIKNVIKKCKDDIEFINNYNYKNKNEKFTLLEFLNFILIYPFKRISYTDVIKILIKYKQKFIYPIHWGINLQSEHEFFLVNEYFKSPIIIFDYPKTVKAFYMRLNDDEKTVSAMDIILPNIGEIIGGSQREERYDILLERMKNININIKNLDWYLDTRIFGSTPHSGFGLGFDRLIQFITGMDNIRDVIPFPRTPNYAEF